MTAPIFDAGEMEVRAASAGHLKLMASFNYGGLAVIGAGGHGRRPKKEKFAPKAFSYAVNDPDREIHLLSGHDFGKPLASKKAGTLVLNDTPKALEFEATFTPAIQRSTWFRDFLATYEAGLIGGISPGFRVAPPEAVAKPEETTEENPALGNALIRTIFHAILFELSLVTRPAYDDTEVELEGEAEERSAGGIILPPSGIVRTLQRWRP